MIGLKRGTVKLIIHQEKWDNEANRTIKELKDFLGNVAIDIQHIGSTAIASIHAKPIIDIVIGVYNLIDIIPYIDVLKEKELIYRGNDVSNQILFVKGDFEKDIRTHHIHVVKWDGIESVSYTHLDKNIKINQDDVIIFISATGRSMNTFMQIKKEFDLDQTMSILITQNLSLIHILLKVNLYLNVVFLQINILI